MSKQISLDEIRIDGGTQMRQQIDYPTVDDYANAFASGARMPPVDVFNDGATNWLANGFHRVHGAKKAGLKKIDCEVHQGTLRDAILFAVGANHDNGLRRTLADKRVAVLKLLNDPEWSKRANNWIADAAKVSDHMVADWRKQVKSTSSSRSCDTGQDGRTTGRDGKKRRNPKRKPAKAAALHVPPIDETTPTAKQMLAANGNQLPVDEAKVQQYAKQMNSGDWQQLDRFADEREWVRTLHDLVVAMRKKQTKLDYDKGAVVHTLTTVANDISEAIQSAEEAA